MKRGDVMDVLEKSLNGWWKVRLGGGGSSDRTGKVPAVYLKPYFGSDPVKSAMSAWDMFGGGGNDEYAPPRSDFIVDQCSSPPSTGSQDLHSWSPQLNHSSSTNEDDSVYYVIQDYSDTTGDVIGELRKGQRVVVLDRENSSSGWWLVRLDDNSEGWAPSAFLGVSWCLKRFEKG